MSGVVMQRPGDSKFTEEEVTAEIERRYQHLDKKQRAALVQRVLRRAASGEADVHEFPRQRADQLGAGPERLRAAS